MKLIYIAAPLFNEMERKRNVQIKEVLEKEGFNVHLPQEAGGVAYDLIKENTEEKKNIRKKIFESDYAAVVKSDIVLFLMDGRTPDEGSCVELGIGFALNKVCVCYKTDSRAMDENGDNNIMIDGCANWQVFKNESDLILHLKELK